MAALDVLTPADLDGCRLIAAPVGSAIHASVAAAFQAGAASFAPAIEVRFMNAALRLVEQGVGVAIIDPLTAASSRDIVVRPFRPALPVRYQAASLHGRPPSRLAGLFLAETRAAIAPHLPQPGDTMPTMRQRLKICVSLAALAITGAWPAGSAQAACTSVAALPASDLVASGKLQMSINPTLPPQQFVDSKGELQGLNVEIGRQIADKLCLEMDFIRMDFPPMIPALQAGRFDGIDTGLFWTEERSKILFLVPYALQSISVTVPTNSPLKLTSIDDLAGKTVVIEVNTYQERWLKTASEAMVARGLAPITIRGFTTATEAMAALRAGQGDAAALLDYMARDMTKRGMVKTELFQLGGAASTMAFRNKVAAEAVAKALTALREDGEYTKLFDKFGLTPLPADQKFEIRGPGPG